MLAHHEPTPHPFRPVYVDIRWAAIICGLSIGHLRRLCRQGKVDGAHRRHGQGHWRIPVSSLDRDLTSAMHWHMNNQLAGPAALA